MEVVCEDCGETNRAGTQFCLFCGAYLSWNPQPDLPARPAAPGPTPGPSAATPVQATADQSRPAPPAPAPGPVPSQPGTAETTVVRDRPAAAQPPPPEPEPAPPQPAACPTCGGPTEPERYFCGRCGHQLRPSPAAQRLPATRRRDGSWWARFTDSDDRLARRAYRQSLPAGYRWRRVILSTVLVALVAALAVASRGHPVAWARSRVDDLRGTLVPVPGVRAGVEPATATLPPSTPGSLLDRTGQAWTLAWAAAMTTTACGPAPGSGTVVLTFPARRVRAFDLHAGLSPTLPDRALEFRPAKLAVEYPGRPCLVVDVGDVYALEKLVADSGIAVTSVRISVMTAHPPPAGGQDRLSISEIGLLARPVR